METAIKTLFDRYHNKVKSNPNLYVQKDFVQVCLPKALHEYANAAAGRNAYGPVGIRVSCDNPSREISRIFSSVESLESFLYSSERNAIQETIIGGRKIRVRVSKAKRPHAVSFRKYFWEHHDKATLSALKQKFPQQELRAAFDSKMSVTDIKEKFGL